MKFEDETLEHIYKVKELGLLITNILNKRLLEHDLSKLNNLEEKTAYATDVNLANKLHYQANAHHPEHFVDGISGMNLIDVIEMLIDWSVNAKGANIHKIIEINKNKFNISEELCSILHNTANDLFL